MSPAAIALNLELEKARMNRQKGNLSKMCQLNDEDKTYTKEYKALQKKSREVNNKYKTYEKEYILPKPTMVGLYYLLKQQIMRMRDSEEVSKIIHI